tara:strand:- start:253 stop:2160 length:1908 start_codon:yes stop_codon:yes gene_type:complete
MAMFKAFKPSGMEKIARAMGYQGNMQGFQDFIAQDPMRQQRMQQFTNQAVQMARGGIVKMQEGGTTTTETTPTETPPAEETPPPSPNIGDITVDRMSTGALPAGGKTVASTTPISQDQLITTGTGELDPRSSISTAVADTTQADVVQEKQANKMEASQSADGVQTALQATQAAQGTVDPRAEVVASQQAKSSVGDLSAAQGAGILMDNPVQREIQDGELISGVADAEKAAKFTEEIQSAQATPTQQATVQGQLEGLLQQFEGGNTPAWAAGAMRTVKGEMARRGLSASSIAGQALVQAAMESALPIAQADASVTAQFEAQNLSNRQQRAMLAAQQRATFMGMEFDQAFQARVQNAGRIADVANMNFTADQQIALENSRIANTMNLQNLSNSQAMVMAEAAALSQLDMANLNNRQQAAVQNAQNFMQMDMQNLSNRQQTEMFKAQQRIQSLFTDQAAENASRQFNATSQNQVDQFFANLQSQTSQFNTSQSNAQNQFNAGQINTVERFNQEIANQRDQFNAQNQLVIAQANAQWRRQIATADTAAVNRANEINAQAVLDISNQAYNNLWQHYADTMEWAWTSAESELDRRNTLAEQQLENDGVIKQSEINKAASNGKAVGNILTEFGTAIIGKWLP